MRLEQLLWLAETIDQGTMHQAALNSFTSTQNISKALKSLETELGVPLLIRSNNGVTPTAEGRYVYEKAVDIRSSLEDLKNIFPSRPSNLMPICRTTSAS